MTNRDLGKIESVSILEVWPNEAADFTPWLAEHIEKLGDALGVELGLRETEAPVGGFSLDILATDVNQARPVVIGLSSISTAVTANSIWNVLRLYENLRMRSMRNSAWARRWIGSPWKIAGPAQ